MTTSGPAGTIIGYDPNDLKVAADKSGAAAKNLADAYAAGGDCAARLKTVTAQIRALEQVSRTGGLYGTITAGPGRDLLNRRVSATSPQRSRPRRRKTICSRTRSPGC